MRAALFGSLLEPVSDLVYCSLGETHGYDNVGGSAEF